MHPAEQPSIYVNYLPTPRRVRRALRIAVPALLWALIVPALLWARAQPDPGAGVWEDAREREFVGTYIASPYPMLAADDTGDGRAGVMLLVQTGKRAAGNVPAERDGARIRLRGWRLQRLGRTMIELLPETAPEVLAPADPAARLSNRPVGPRAVRGEIVDSKCCVCSMKPGEAKAHKACATLRVRTEDVRRTR